MANNIKREKELYSPMCEWLKNHLEDKYKRQKCDIIVVECHSNYLDFVLEKNNVIQYFPQTVGLKIQIDVLGIVIWENSAKIFLIEAKKDSLTLQNLGQLLIYCRLCDPEEAYLLSSKGLGSLEKVLVNLNRDDILDFGLGKQIKKINVARWEVSANTISQFSKIPKFY